MYCPVFCRCCAVPTARPASLSDVHVFFSPVVCTFNRYHFSVLNTGGTGIVLCSINGHLLHSCLSYAGNSCYVLYFLRSGKFNYHEFCSEALSLYIPAYSRGYNTLLACSLSSSYSAEIAKKLAIDFTNDLSSISLDSPFLVSIHLCSRNILVILRTFSYSQKKCSS
jgi:hypothetical protein